MVCPPSAGLARERDIFFFFLLHCFAVLALIEPEAFMRTARHVGEAERLSALGFVATASLRHRNDNAVREQNRQKQPRSHHTPERSTPTKTNETK
jgi:hypothetical protein